MTPWTPERIDAVLRLWPDHSAAAIATRLECTRFAVLGVVRRSREPVPTKRPLLPPLTEQEMRDMWVAGDSLSDIAGKAKHRNGLGKAAVRQIVMGHP